MQPQLITLFVDKQLVTHANRVKNTIPSKGPRRTVRPTAVAMRSLSCLGQTFHQFRHWLLQWTNRGAFRFPMLLWKQNHSGKSGGENKTNSKNSYRRRHSALNCLALPIFAFLLKMTKVKLVSVETPISRMHLILRL